MLDMAAVIDFLRSDAVFKRFSQVKCLREEQKDCIKIWSMKDDFEIFPISFWKSLIFQPFPRAMSLISGEAGAIFAIMEACLALKAILNNEILS